MILLLRGPWRHPLCFVVRDGLSRCSPTEERMMTDRSPSHGSDQASVEHDEEPRPGAGAESPEEGAAAMQDAEDAIED